MARLGNWSYGVYLYQRPVLAEFGAVLGLSPMRSGAAVVIAYLLAVVATAGILFHAFENPARRVLRGRVVAGAALPGLAP